MHVSHTNCKTFIFSTWSAFVPSCAPIFPTLFIHCTALHCTQVLAQANTERELIASRGRVRDLEARIVALEGTGATGEDPAKQAELLAAAQREAAGAAERRLLADLARAETLVTSARARNRELELVSGRGFCLRVCLPSVHPFAPTCTYPPLPVFLPTKHPHTSKEEE